MRIRTKNFCEIYYFMRLTRAMSSLFATLPHSVFRVLCVPSVV